MDETAALLGQAKRGEVNRAEFMMINEPVFNIDDMEGRCYMGNHRMSGCYAVICKADLAEEPNGRYYVNGVYAGTPIIGHGFMGGCDVGVFLRKMLTEYDTDYQVRLEGLVTKDGTELAPFEFTIHTLPHVAPGTVYPEHDPIVLQAAREGAVLLKNEGVLPLGKNAVVNAFGGGAPAYRLGCVGAAKINPRYGIRFESGLKKYSSLQLNQPLFDFYRDEIETMPPAELLQQAQALSDTAIYVIGRPTGEGQDTPLAPGGYYLTEGEKSVIAGLRQNFKKLLVILNTGYPVEMGWADQADAILWTGLNGMAGGRAVVEILEGIVNPSGRLPDTWAIDYHDIPSALNYPLQPEKMGFRFSRDPNEPRPFNVTVYEEGLYVGYRYFETFNKPVAFPFGHGLSYTTFKRECVRFVSHGANIEMDIRVTNTGYVPGKESVLLFAELPEGKLEQPSRRLVDFAKTDILYPGSSDVLHLKVDARGFDSYDEENARWIIEPGTIKLYVGGSVREAVETASVEIPELIVVKQVKNRVYPPFKVNELSHRDPEGTWPKGEKSEVKLDTDLPYRRWREMTPELRPVIGEKPDHLITYPMLVEDPSLLNAFVLQMSDYELCRASSGGKTGWGFGESGYAGSLYTIGEMEKYQLPSQYYLADGNNGLNMNDANIGFPVSNVMAATFNEELSYQEGCAIAEEAVDMSLLCILGPATNLHRNPLCGRQAEYFSEDPVLAGRMAGHWGRGLQNRGIACSLKHFFANNAEFLRGSNHAIMSERTARELYLRIFEEVFQVYMPDTVMTGYNAANGVWCGEDEELLSGILREEWGFTGYVMTDWGGGNSCAGGAPAQAGLAWIAPGSMDDSTVTPILEALQSGKLDRERLKANVRDIMRILAKYARYTH